MSITEKTTATLIDELYTTELKLLYNPSYANKHRELLLKHAVSSRVGGRWKAIEETLRELKQTLRQCWDAQEIVCSSIKQDEVYWAAKEAQRLNKARNILIREIDTILDEQDYTQLEKSY